MGRVESMTTPSRDLCGIFLLYRCAERWFTSRSENALCVLGCLKDRGADREDEGRYNRAAGPSAQHSGQFRRAGRKKN
jgi:glutamate synthase domain-containing protein 1